MGYDFDRQIDRRNTGSLKWDIPEGELPMWVADMDFAAAPEIQEALAARVSHGVFGYNIVPDAWYEAYQNWWSRRHHLEIPKEALIFCTGVIPGLSSTVRKLTTPNENVVILTPVYNIFFNSIVNNGARVLECPLQYDEETMESSIHWALLEEYLSNPQTSLLIFCNPQNPVGKIWPKEDLARVGELCAKYQVTVFADEIHCDLTDPGKEYVPFASVSETCANISITAIAPTKTFNLAGLQTAALMIPNPFLRHKVNRAINTDEVAEPGTLAVPAAIAAFEKGEPWLNALRQYIYDNKKLVETATTGDGVLAQNGIRLVPSEATYLLWLDCKKWLSEKSQTDGRAWNVEMLANALREKTGLYLTEGSHYGAAGEGFLRMNIACPRENVLDALKRFAVFFES